MTNPVEAIRLAFDTLTLKEQELVAQELRQRANDHWDREKHTVREIEVVGAYDEPFDTDQPKRSLPASDAETVRGFISREQVLAHLRQLPDAMLNVRRFIQWRLLEDGSLWQGSGCVYITRPLPSTDRLAPDQIQPLNTSLPYA
jgi:hypothetical protein